MANSCPVCHGPIVVSKPPPEKVICPNCRAVIKISGDKRAGVQPAAEPPGTLQPIPPVDTRNFFEKKTELVPMPAETAGPFAQHAALTPMPSAPFPPTQPANRRQMLRRMVVGAAGVVLLVAVMVAAIIMMLDRNSTDNKEKIGSDKKQSRPEQPQVLIDEDFRMAFKNRLNVPEGWTHGDGFRIIALNDEPCLEISTPKGAPFVTLPPVTLRGNFSIDGVYILGHLAKLIIRLENRNNNDLLPIIFDSSGAITIGSDVRAALPNFKPQLPTKFLVTRKGQQLNILLNGELVAAKDLGMVNEYESLKLGLVSARPTWSARLFRFKVVRLPEN